MPPATAVARKVHGDASRNKFAWSVSDENARTRAASARSGRRRTAEADRARTAEPVARQLGFQGAGASAKKQPRARRSATVLRGASGVLPRTGSARALGAKVNPAQRVAHSKGMPVNKRNSPAMAQARVGQGGRGGASIRAGQVFPSQVVRSGANSLAVAATAPAARAIASTGAFAASSSRAALSVLVGGRQEGRRVDGILRGRAYIVAISVLLAGLVALNVDLLSLNKDINHYVERSTELKRSNSTLVGEVARLESSERIARRAQRLGLAMPAPEQFRYLKSRPGVDGRRAAINYRPPVAKPVEQIPAITSQPVAAAPAQPVAAPQATAPVQPEVHTHATQPAAPPAPTQTAGAPPAPTQTQATGVQ